MAIKDRENDEMAVDQDQEHQLKSAASKRKGRGFTGSKGRPETIHYESLDVQHDAIGKAQKCWIVLVTNVHEELTEEDLIDQFQEFGPIKNLHLNLDRRTGYVKGYALIEYRDYEQAKEAISQMDGTELQGQTLKCDFAFVRGPGHSKSEQVRKSRK